MKKRREGERRGSMRDAEEEEKEEEEEGEFKSKS